MEKSEEDTRPQMTEELMLWYNAVIIRLIDEKNQLEEVTKTHQITLSTPSLG